MPLDVPHSEPAAFGDPGTAHVVEPRQGRLRAATGAGSAPPVRSLQDHAIDATIPFRKAKQSGVGGKLGEVWLHAYTPAHIINAVALDEA